MESPTLADKMAQTFSRNERVLAKREKIHPAVKQAKALFGRRIGMAMPRARSKQK